MTLTEIKEKRNLVLDEVKAMQEVAEKEERKLTEDETKEVDTKLAEVRELDKEYDQKKETLDLESRQFETETKNNPTIMENKNFTFNLNEKKGKIPAELLEVRTVTAGATKGMEVNPLVGALVPELVLSKAGAKIYTNVSDNKLPVASAPAVPGFKSETGTADSRDINFTELVFTPKRIPVEIPVSRRFLKQDEAGATAYIIGEAKRIISEKLERTILSNTASTSTSPAGIFKDVSVNDLSGAVTRANVLEQRNTLAQRNVNVDNIKMVPSFDVEGKMLGSKVDAGSGLFLAEDGKVAKTGIDIVPTSLLSFDSSIDAYLMGDFSQLHICQFGDMEYQFDETTQFSDGIVLVKFNSEWDYKLAHPQAVVGVVNVSA